MVTQQKVRSRLYCNHCKQSADRARDLDEHFLCAKCRVIPGVRGYRDPSKRGLEGGGPEYWERMKDQLNVITDDAPETVPKGTARSWRERFDDAVGDFVVEPYAPRPIGGTLKRWRVDARAQGKGSDVKLLLLTLADHADYDTERTRGGNCFPSLRTLAKELGWTATHVRRTTIEARRDGWLLIGEVEVPRGDTVVRKSNHYILRWPDGRRLSDANDKRA